MKVEPAKMDDFFRLDYRTGSVTSLLTNERMQVIPAIKWVELKEKLTQETHEYAPLVVVRLGAALGSAFIEEMMSELSDPESLAKHLSDLAAAAGWGVISMTGDLRYGSRYTVAVANCVFCHDEDLASAPQCGVLEGILKGMADRVYGTPHKVREDRCAAMGEALCQLSVEEASYDSETGESLEGRPVRAQGLQNVEDLEKYLDR